MGFFIPKYFCIFVNMSKVFHKFFDSYRVKDESPTTVNIGFGRNIIGSIELYPSETNPFIDGYGYVRVYDNGELHCDEHLAKLIMYTDLHNEFMEFCFDLWKFKTNKKICPNCIILPAGDRTIMDERRSYRYLGPKNYLVE